MLLPFLLTACSDNDEPNAEMQEKHVIEFSTHAVSPLSRAGAEGYNPGFSAFSVYGFVRRPDSYIFDGETVYRQPDGKWICDRAEYWYPKQTYYFTALAPADAGGMSFTPARQGTGTSGGGGIVNYDISVSQGKEDILFSIMAVSTNRIFPPPVVEFEFEHLLSQIRFSFYNELQNPDYLINVINAEISGVPKSGVIDKTHRDNVWEQSGSETTSLTVDESVTVRPDSVSVSSPVFIIPVYIPGISVTIKAEVVDSRTMTPLSDVSTIGVPLPEIDLQPGKTYNLVCRLKSSNFKNMPQSSPARAGENTQQTLPSVDFVVEDGFNDK